MKIVIYTKYDCPWCTKAKNLLRGYNLPFQEIMVGVPKFTVADFKEKFDSLGITSVPQIYIDDQLIGGYNELAGELDNQIGS